MVDLMETRIKRTSNSSNLLYPVFQLLSNFDSTIKKVFNVLLFPNGEVVVLGDFKNIWLKYSTHTDQANQLIELLTRIPDKVIITELFLNTSVLTVIVPLENPDHRLMLNSNYSNKYHKFMSCGIITLPIPLESREIYGSSLWREVRFRKRYPKLRRII